MLITTKGTVTIQQLLDYFKPPVASAPTQSASTDSNTYIGGSYLKELNRSYFINYVNKHNTDQFTAFGNNVSAWFTVDHKQKEFSQAAPPPVYWEFDNQGDDKSFESWWSNAMANNWVFGPVNFVTQAPAIPPVIFLPDIVVTVPQPLNPLGDDIPGDQGYKKPAPGDVSPNGTEYVDPVTSHKWIKRLGPFDVASNGGGVWQDLTATGGVV